MAGVRFVTDVDTYLSIIDSIRKNGIVETLKKLDQLAS